MISRVDMDAFEEMQERPNQKPDSFENMKEEEADDFMKILEEAYKYFSRD